MKKCIICGKEFEPKSKRHMTCSNECSTKHGADLKTKKRHTKLEKHELICKYCGKPFIVESYRPLTRRKYCSQKCRQNYEYYGGTKPVSKKKFGKAEPRKCDWCGKTFSPTKVQPMAKFCSSYCYQKMDCKKRSDKRKQKRELELSIPRKCPQCKQDFIATAYVQKYCSVECRQKNKANVLKERYTNLPKATKTELNNKKRDKFKLDGNWRKALDRDGNKCVLCGKTEKLEVHHLDGNGEKGKDKRRKANDTSLENLMTLCSSCHKDMHGIFLIYKNDEWTLRSDIFDKLKLTGTIKIE